MGVGREKEGADGGQTTVGSRELLRRIRDGDDDAGNRLFARYLPQLYRWAHRRVPQWARNAVDTADLVQETILHTLRRLGSFEPRRDGALLGYLRRSLRNRILDQFRIATRRPEPVSLDGMDHVAPGDSPLDLAMSREARTRYVSALRRLRADDRHAIVARLELGYSYEQIALALQKPTAEAARLAIRRALLRLAREMEHV